MMLQPRAWLEQAVGFVYPNVCQICQKEDGTPAEGYVGAHCRSGVKVIVPPFCERCGLPYEGEFNTPFECTNCRELDLHFDQARSAVRARGMVLDVIHRYKYQHAVWFENFLGKLLVEQAVPALNPADWDAIVPVPLHPLREREREFNQAERLARVLGRHTGIPVLTRCLKRVRPTQTQTLLTRDQRAANMRKAFALRANVPVEGLACVLVDDVFTTGATTSACAKVLKAAGARAVCVWTVARGV